MSGDLGSRDLRALTRGTFLALRIDTYLCTAYTGVSGIGWAIGQPDLNLMSGISRNIKQERGLNGEMANIGTFIALQIANQSKRIKMVCVIDFHTRTGRGYVKKGPGSQLRTRTWKWEGPWVHLGLSLNIFDAAVECRRGTKFITIFEISVRNAFKHA